MGRGLLKWVIDTMYHVVKQYLRIGHLQQLIVIGLAAVVQSVTYIKFILRHQKAAVE